MSLPPSDPDLLSTYEDFKRGGWIVILLSAAGVTVRLLVSGKRHTWVAWFSKLAAGTIVGVLAYFILHGTEIPAIYKSVCYSCAGAFAPELFEKGLAKLMGKPSGAL